jgi:hypothetical protein
MKRKIVVMFCVMLFFTILIPVNVLSGDEEDPEIRDIIGDARSYLDIEKAWFYEDADEPDFLYTVIQLAQPNAIPLKQHLTIHWEMNGEIYWTMCGIGYGGSDRVFFNSGKGYDQWYDRAIVHDINGDFISGENGLVICRVPKETIGDPEPGDVLTKTECQCFQRFGLWGRMGFSPRLRMALFRTLGLDSLWIIDSAPDNDPSDDIREYGNDYVIQY